MNNIKNFNQFINENEFTPEQKIIAYRGAGEMIDSRRL